MKKDTRATTILANEIVDLSSQMEMAVYVQFWSENKCIERDIDRLEDFEKENNVVFIAVNPDGLAAARYAYDLLTGGGSGNDELLHSDLLNAVEKMLGLEPRG